MVNTSFPSAQYPLRNPSQIDALGFTLTCLYGQFLFEHKPAMKHVRITFSYYSLDERLLSIRRTLQEVRTIWHSLWNNLHKKINETQTLDRSVNALDHIQFVGPHI